MLYCFTDTNIFLEFRPVTEIKWLNELNTSSVCLMVTSAVVRELDKHKAGNNNRLRKRARKRIAFLEGLDTSTDNEIQSGVTLQFDLAEPKPGTITDNNLSSDFPDDVLIAKAIEFKAQHPAANVAMISDDATVRLKARGYDLIVPTLSEDCRLPHEIDPLEKEIRELRNELLKRQNRQPNLRFGFIGENGKIEGHFRTAICFEENLISEDELSQAIEKKRKELKYPRRHTNSSTGIYAVDYDIIGATQEQVDVYRDEVREFLAGSYRSYLYQNSLYRVFHISAIKVPLVLENSGSFPARGIEIALTISGVREILSGKPTQFDYPASPVYPTARQSSQILSNLGYSIGPDFRSNWVVVQGTESDMWFIEESDISSARVAQCYFDQLTHNKRTGLDDLFLIVDQPEKFPASVSISFEIIAENVIDKITEQLTVIIDELPP